MVRGCKALCQLIGLRISDACSTALSKIGGLMPHEGPVLPHYTRMDFEIHERPPAVSRRSLPHGIGVMCSTVFCMFLDLVWIYIFEFVCILCICVYLLACYTRERP